MKNKEIVPSDYYAEVSDFYNQLAENCAGILGRVVSRDESKSITYSLAYSAPVSFIADMLGTTNEKAGKVFEEIFKLQENLYTKMETLREQEIKTAVGEMKMTDSQKKRLKELIDINISAQLAVFAVDSEEFGPIDIEWTKKVKEGAESIQKELDTFIEELAK